MSYLGSNNHPPDFIIRNGRAVEVKKSNKKSNGGSIVLNSSYPRDDLHSDDTKITNACIECESDLGGWDEKLMMYALGRINEGKLKRLWFIDGNCYCADKSKYEEVIEDIESGVQEIPDKEFSETNEFGKLKKVDPLGVTRLRVRGMWDIDHPDTTYKSTLNEHFEENGNDTYIDMMVKTEEYEKMTENIESYDDCSNRIEVVETEVVNPNNDGESIEVTILQGRITN